MGLSMKVKGFFKFIIWLSISGPTPPSAAPSPASPPRSSRSRSALRTLASVPPAPAPAGHTPHLRGRCNIIVIKVGAIDLFIFLKKKIYFVTI